MLLHRRWPCHVAGLCVPSRSVARAWVQDGHRAPGTRTLGRVGVVLVFFTLQHQVGGGNNPTKAPLSSLFPGTSNMWLSPVSSNGPASLGSWSLGLWGVRLPGLRQPWPHRDLSSVASAGDRPAPVACLWDPRRTAWPGPWTCHLPSQPSPGACSVLPPGPSRDPFW